MLLCYRPYHLKYKLTICCFKLYLKLNNLKKLNVLEKTIRIVLRLTAFFKG